MTNTQDMSMNRRPVTHSPLAAWELQYLNIMRELLDSDDERDDRTGTGTFALFGRRITVDLRHSFPVPKTKKLNMRAVAVELCWMLRGLTTLDYLHEHNVHFWDANCPPSGDLGPVYGAQLRGKNGGAGGVDQLALLLDHMRDKPHSRHHVMTFWRPDQLELMALRPCHGIDIQTYIHGDGSVSLSMGQRSADWFLGVPFNIASYALLTHLIAHLLGRDVNSLIINFGDTHMYRDHRRQCQKQYDRMEKVSGHTFAQLAPLPECVTLPEMLEPGHVELIGYEPMGWIKAPMSA